MSITIIKPGISTSIQDLGRWGFQQFGVPIGGAMDKVSAAVANIICGNDDNEAVIEMTLHGTSILFNEPAYCALVGGGCKAYIDDRELPFNRLLHLPAYCMITTKPAASGCRSYLSVAGGLKINKEMGSASTYVPSGIGGVGGRNLVTGDMIPFRTTVDQSKPSSTTIHSNKIGVSPWQLPHLLADSDLPVTIHMVHGPEFARFDTRAQESVFNTSFSITPPSNRIGYRLAGEQLNLKQKIEMVSTAVTAGIIQVTHEGNLIILMADAQTTGGYPRIGHVCSADIPLLAQLKPGAKIKFTAIGEQESVLRSQKMGEALSKMRTGFNLIN